MLELINLPIHKFTITEDDDRFLRLELWLCTVGENLNKSYIDKNAYEYAKSSIEYIPMCGLLSQDKKEFLGHEELEKPFGCILDLNNNNYRYEIDIKNGLEYVVVDAIVFKQYCEDEVKVILSNNGKCNISIEIEVEDGFLDAETKVYHIEKFKYLCTTAIGEDPGMKDAHLQVQYTKTIDYIKEELQQYFSSHEKKNEIIENPKISTENFSEDINKQSKEEEETSMNKKEIAIKYSLTAIDLYNVLCNALSAQTYISDWCGQSMECPRYSIDDFDDTYVYADDNELGIDVEIPYVMNGDNPELDFDNVSRVKYVPQPWDNGTDAVDGAIADDDSDSTSDFSKINKENTEKFISKIVEAKVLEAVTTKETELNAAFAITLEATKVEFAEKEEAFNKSAENIESVEAKIEIPVEAPIEVVPVEATFVESDNVELDTKNDAIIALNERFTALESTLKDKESVIAEKDALIEALKSDNEEFNSKERQEKVEAIFSKFSKVLSKEEIDDFRKKESTFAKIEEFAKELKAFCADKLVETFKNETAKVSRMGLIGNEANEDIESKNEPSTLWERLDNKLKTNK